MQLFDVYPLQPLAIVRGQGTYVWDAQDQRYLDMYGGHAVISIGHSHPHWVARIEDQLKKLAFYSNSVHMPIQEQLAEKLGLVSGKPDYQLFLCNSGAEANENALKLASFHTGKKTILAMRNGFHGRTSLAVAATDNPSIIAPVNQNENVVFLPFNDEQALETAFAQHEVAAVIIEGIQGVGGIREASVSFLQKIRALCDANNAVYIADSVQCGYGRSGQFFAHDYAGVQADIYTTAKGMGNGFPVAGVVIAPHLKPKYGMLGTTFGGNPLACAAALAVLEVIEQEGLMENARIQGEYLMHALRGMPVLENVRGRGLMIGFDLPEAQAGLRKKLLMEQGVFTGEAKPRVVRLLPSLALTRVEADLFLEKMHAALLTDVPILH
jgi:acetylornithine aminotransferase